MGITLFENLDAFVRHEYDPEFSNAWSGKEFGSTNFKFSEEDLAWVSKEALIDEIELRYKKLKDSCIHGRWEFISGVEYRDLKDFEHQIAQSEVARRMVIATRRTSIEERVFDSLDGIEDISNFVIGYSLTMQKEHNGALHWFNKMKLGIGGAEYRRSPFNLQEEITENVGDLLDFKNELGIPDPRSMDKFKAMIEALAVQEPGNIYFDFRGFPGSYRDRKSQAIRDEDYGLAQRLISDEREKIHGILEGVRSNPQVYLAAREILSSICSCLPINTEYFDDGLDVKTQLGDVSIGNSEGLVVSVSPNLEGCALNSLHGDAYTLYYPRFQWDIKIKD